MKTINEYVDASLNFQSADKSLRKELSERIGIRKDNIKSVTLKTYSEDDIKLVQVIVVELIGTNCIYLDNIRDIKGLSIVTPNRIEIIVSEMDL